MNKTMQISAAALCLLLACPVASAQGSAKRPMRVIVPVAPGGPADTVIRLLTPRMSEALGQVIVVDNRPSANGVAGTEIAARALPDGYTITTGNSGTHAINATLYRKLPYDPVRDFVAISQFITTGMVLVANPRVAAASFQDLVALAKKQPGRITVGVAGATGQLAGDALWSQTHIKMNNVHYKGSGPTELALVSGEIELSLLTPLASMSHLKAGKLKAFGITSTHRAPLLPAVPTLAEQGVQGYDFQFWNGLFAPAKTPDQAVRAVHKAVVHALNAPEVKERITQLGFMSVGSSPEDFAKFVKSEVSKFRKIILESGIPLL
jgi:tripartite-type tricarboxylate transporter receptor subunit TctC